VPFTHAKRMKIWKKQLKMLKERRRKSQWMIGFIPSVETKMLADMELTPKQSLSLARNTQGEQYDVFAIEDEEDTPEEVKKVKRINEFLSTQADDERRDHGALEDIH